MRKRRNQLKSTRCRDPFFFFFFCFPCWIESRAEKRRGVFHFQQFECQVTTLYPCPRQQGHLQPVEEGKMLFRSHAGYYSSDCISILTRIKSNQKHSCKYFESHEKIKENRSEDTKTEKQHQTPTTNTNHSSQLCNSAPSDRQNQLYHATITPEFSSTNSNKRTKENCPICKKRKEFKTIIKEIQSTAFVSLAASWPHPCVS